MADDDKPTTFLLPSAVRSAVKTMSTPMPQRRFSKVVAVVLVVAAVYCLAVTVTSWSPHQYIQNVIVNNPAFESKTPTSSWSSKVTPEPTRMTTSAREWRPGSTMRAPRGTPQPNFRQESDTVVVVREGGDVQLDCLLAKAPHAIVAWYKEKSKFLAMGKRTYVDDDRIDVNLDMKALNWALRIRDVSIEDAGQYSCHLALSSNDLVTVTLDVLPLDEAASRKPSTLRGPLSEDYEPGFTTLPSKCAEQGAALDAVIVVLSHPLYRSNRQRIRHTWGSTTDPRLAVVFSMGSINAAINANVTVEAEAHGDVLVGNFQDDHTKPLTAAYKLVSALQWSAEHCGRAGHTLVVTHTDWVSTHRLKAELAALSPDTAEVRGSCDGDTTVTRDPAQPRYLSYAAYQRPSVPRYCQAPFLVSRAAVPRLYAAALDERPIRLPDELVTGLAAEAAGVPRVNMPALYKLHQRVETCEYDQFVVGMSWGEVVERTVLDRIAKNVTCTG